MQLVALARSYKMDQRVSQLRTTQLGKGRSVVPAVKAYLAHQGRDYQGERCSYCGALGLIDLHPTKYCFVRPPTPGNPNPYF